ncbi:MAG: LEM-3-like GIY-YIG domain-containing protein [Gammaproteobacteria bacterium]
MNFPSNIHDSLKNYLYAYYDPSDGSSLPFYIGRGVKNRAFDHLKESHSDEVQTVINKIKRLGMKPIVKIILHGLTLQQVKAAETAAIALLGKDNLANLKAGSGSGLTNTSPRELIDHYNAKDVTIKHKVIMIVRNPWDPNVSEALHYDRTRSAWNLGPKKDFADYVFLVHQGVVKRVYKIADWYPDGTTFHYRNDPSHQYYLKDYGIRERFEFVGRLIEPHTKFAKLYIGKSVKKYIRARGSPDHYSYNAKGEVYKFDSNNKITNLP